MKCKTVPPFGYYAEEGSRRLRPIEDDLSALQDVKEMLDIGAFSLRDAALWLSDKASRNISHEGLRLRLQRPVRLEDERGENSVSDTP